MRENEDWLDALLRQPMPERRDDDFVADVLSRLKPRPALADRPIRPLILSAAGFAGLAAIIIGLGAGAVPDFYGSLLAALSAGQMMGSNGLTILFVILLSVALPLLLASDDGRAR